MSVSIVQRAVLYIKEIQEVGLFAVMADSRLFMAFGGSPLYYVMLPFIGLLSSVLAVINGYQLAKASNKNFDKWFGFVVSAICAVLASVSLYGAALSTAYGLAFAAGPWFFLASVSLAFCHQLVMLGLNGYRAYESFKGSSQRMHYIQAALNNLFNLGLLTGVIGAVVFVMLSPIAPLVGSICAITAVTFTFTNIVWRVLPPSWKRTIKGLFYLEKPELPQHDEPKYSSDSAPVPSLDKEVQHHRIFSKCDYSALVKGMDFKAGESYLQNLITRKIAVLHDDSLPQDEKNNQKAAVLTFVSSALARHTPISKAALLEQYPLAFQSFWAEKGDVEQLFDAALILGDKYEQSMKNNAAPVDGITIEESKHAGTEPSQSFC